MLRVNDKEWEIEVNGFPVGHLFGSLRAAFQKLDENDHKMAIWPIVYGEYSYVLWNVRKS